MKVKICRGLNCLQCPIRDSACIVLEAEIEKEMEKEAQPKEEKEAKPT